MARTFVRQLCRGAPFAVSCAIHLVLVGAALAVVARLAPRMEAVIHAHLVPDESTSQKMPAPEPVVRAPVSRPVAPPIKKPLELPRLIESRPTVEPPVRRQEPPQVITEPSPVKQPSTMEKSHSEMARTEPLPEPHQSSTEPTRQASGGSGASSALTDTRSPDDLPSGVSMLSAIERAPGGSGAGGTGGGGGATSSTPGASAGGITRTAIPKGGRQVQPRYPTSARRLGIQGTTVLRVFVAGDGRVTEIAVERTAGHADLDEAAAEAVRRWRFEPARRGDEPVSMWVLLPVEFRLR